MAIRHMHHAWKFHSLLQIDQGCVLLPCSPKKSPSWTKRAKKSVSIQCSSVSLTFLKQCSFSLQVLSCSSTGFQSFSGSFVTLMAIVTRLSFGFKSSTAWPLSSLSLSMTMSPSSMGSNSYLFWVSSNSCWRIPGKTYISEAYFKKKFLLLICSQEKVRQKWNEPEIWSQWPMYFTAMGWVALSIGGCTSVGVAPSMGGCTSVEVALSMGVAHFWGVAYPRGGGFDFGSYLEGIHG